MTSEITAVEQVKTIDTGPLFLYVLSLPVHVARLEIADQQFVVVPVISRRNGILLAAPHGILPAELLVSGDSADVQDLVGPSRMLQVEAIVEEDNGTETEHPDGLLVDLVDFHAAVLGMLREFDPVTDSRVQSFSVDFPEVVPKPASLLTQAYEWLQMAEEDRINYYTAAEEVMEPFPKQSARKPALASSPSEPAPKKVTKRVTAAALAEQVSGLAQTLPALTQQLEALQVQQQRLQEAVTSGPVQQRTPAYRQPFQTPPAMPQRAKANAYFSEIAPPQRPASPPKSFSLASQVEEELPCWGRSQTCCPPKKGMPSNLQEPKIPGLRR